MQTIEFRHSIQRAALYALSSGVCALYSLASALQWLPENAAQGRIGYLIGLVVFVPFTAFQLWRIYDRTPVITLSSEGLRDTRLAPQTIPWSGVAKLALGEQRRNKFLLVTPKPETLATLQLTRTAQLYQDGLRASGIDGLRVAAQGLDLPHEFLVEAAAQFWRAYRGPGFEEAESGGAEQST